MPRLLRRSFLIRGSVLWGTCGGAVLLASHLGCGSGSVGNAPLDGGAIERDSSTGTETDASPDASSGVTLTLSPTTLRLGTDQHATIHVSVARNGNGAFPISLSGSFAGLNPFDGELGANETETDVPVWAISETNVDGDAVLRAIVNGKEVSRASFHVSIAGLTTGLDKTFGELGVASMSSTITGLNPSANTTGLVVASDGSIFVTGNLSGNDGDASKMFRAHFSEAGKLDASFANGMDSSSPVDAQAVAATVDDAGKLVVAANDLKVNTQGVLFRYAADGKLDTTFATTGASTFSPIQFQSVTSLTDGSIFGGGYPPNGKRTFAIAKAKSDGTADTAVGVSGIASLTTEENTTSIQRFVRDGASGVFVGGIGVGGAPAKSHYVLVHLSSSGALDPSFGTSGVRTIDIDPNTPKADFVRLSDGKLLVVFSSHQAALRPYRLTFTRLTANGAVDTSFGNGGQTTVDSELDVKEVLPSNDGKIYVVGNAVQLHFAIARYTAAGTLDTLFGVNGMLTMDSHGQRAAIAHDGKIIVASNTTGGVALRRYFP